MQPPSAQPRAAGSFDKSLLLAIVFLLGLGLVQVYSSSYMYAIEKQGDGLFFFRRQIGFCILTLLVMGLIARLSWRRAEQLAIGLWAISICAVAATFIPGLGVKVGGAQRWLQLPLGLRFEPAELLRVTFPLVFAVGLTKKKPILAGILLLPLLLVLAQNDFGSFAICAAVALALVFLNGLPWGYVIAGIGSFAVSAYFLIVHEPYRLARITSFLDPWSDPAEGGFQVIQSMLSFYSGGLWGVGLGHGQGKLFFLPEAHTDFTLAVLAEEAGFFGYSMVLLIYGFLMFRGLQIAMRTESFRHRLIASGLTLTMSLSVFINTGVVTGLLPTKGLTLPFLSYGGSSLLCTGIAYGLLLSLERHSSRAGLRN
jgi:cell division protein FtsW